MTQRTDTWSAGDLYEPYVGRWSRRVAVRFIDWLGLATGLSWLDVGCGTGALTQTLLARARPASVLGIDASAGFIAHARAHTADARASFLVGDAQGLPLEPSPFDAAVAGLLLNFLPDPARTMAGMVRAVQPGGTVAAYVWDYAEGMALMRHFWDVAVALDPAAARFDEGRRESVCAPQPLQALFASAGLDRVKVDPIDIETPFRDFDDYWTPFLGGQGSAPGYAVSLAEPDRARLRERLRLALPTQPDGRIVLQARAWAVRGQVH
ncbi:class I SAM-dependent methyltransferase [Variovorax sp. JS1663]|uniref:class I SAM-dependent methyltransferase n=1 Tax=Variovorax sp. JS1663 TaxID=1851577 RepID=UPI000B34355D|nr:class I SAM-dependent methyltransferase [Variovorax sp. JS1663]OUM02605.1 methyltransferase [Variovorax sp. JS1663]